MNKDLLKENRMHGDTMYPVSVYSDAYKTGSSSLFDCHWHDELEFFVVMEGKAVFQIDTSHFEVHAGEAVFINSGEIHACYPLNHSRCVFSAVVFSADMLRSSTTDTLQQKFIDPVVEKRYVPPFHFKGVHDWEAEILSQLKEIFRLNTSKAFTYELSTKARLYLILSCIYANCRSRVPKTSYTENNYKIERIKNVLNYIHANYAERLRLTDLAAQANMSEGHFCRFFKQMVKKTPIDYLNYFRVYKAARLLQNSNKKIYEVAFDVGFDNLSYFISMFRKYEACTPSKYRKVHSGSFDGGKIW